MIEYDDEAHTYTLDGVLLPHVTGILRDMMPGYQAGEWYLQRGKAVHECAAMILRGEDFDYDPVIAGQVAAARLFVREYNPIVVEVERIVAHPVLGYAGRLDAIVALDGRLFVLDWKSSMEDSLPYQLVAYALAYQAETGNKIRNGIGVELREDGTYRAETYHGLDLYKARWRAMLREWKRNG